MSTADQKTPSIEEMTVPQPPSGNAGYLAWAEEKIRASVAADDAKPERRKSLDEVMNEHGVS